METSISRRETMSFWEKVRKDLQKGLKEGMAAVREGATVVREKAGELGDEAKKQYRIYDLKSKVQKWIAELGGLVYELQAKAKDPMQDTTVKLMISRIKKLEAQIVRLEGRPKTAPKKPAPKSRSRTVK